MTEFFVLNERLYKVNDYNNMVPNDNINVRIQNWLSKNPDFVPYGEYTIQNKEFFVQPFIKYSNRLNDKFLELLIDELKLAPGFGSAYREAEERFRSGMNELKVLPPPHTGGRKTRKNRKK